MQRSVKFAVGSVVLAAMLLGSACASCYDGPRSGDLRHVRSKVSVGFYDGWYDGYYGPVHEVYWGDDRFFYYRAGPRGPWIVDRDNHFRRDRFAGGHSFQYRSRR